MSTIEERRLMRLKKTDLVKLILGQQEVINAIQVNKGALELKIMTISKLENALSDAIKQKKKSNKKLKSSKRKIEASLRKIEDSTSEIENIKCEIEVQKELTMLRESELKDACLENLSLTRQCAHLENKIKYLVSERLKIVNFNYLKQKLTSAIIEQKKKYPYNSTDYIYEYLSDSRNDKEIEQIFDSFGYKHVKFYEYKIIYTKMKNIRNNLAHATGFCPANNIPE